MHNLKPGSLSDSTAEKLKLTPSRPCYILLRYCRRCPFAFRFPPFCCAPSTVKFGRMHSATPSSIPLWGVKLQASDRAANYSAAFHSTAITLIPVVWLCCSSPKKKVQSFQAQSKTVSGQASIHFVSTLLAATCPIPCCNQPALSLAAAGQPYDPQGAIKRLTVPSILKVNRHFQTHRWPFVPCRPGMPQGGETHGHGDTAFHGLSLTGKAEQFIFINSHPFPKCGSREIEVWPIQHACKSRAAN